MKFLVCSRVRYVGPENIDEHISPGDIGSIIEDYEDGNYEVEFSDLNGITKSQTVISYKHLVMAEED